MQKMGKNVELKKGTEGVFFLPYRKGHLGVKIGEIVVEGDFFYRGGFDFGRRRFLGFTVCDLVIDMIRYTWL